MKNDGFNMRRGARVVEAADRLDCLFGGDSQPDVMEKMVGTGKDKLPTYRMMFADGSVLTVPAQFADQFCDRVGDVMPQSAIESAANIRSVGGVGGVSGGD